MAPSRPQVSWRTLPFVHLLVQARIAHSPTARILQARCPQEVLVEFGRLCSQDRMCRGRQPFTSHRGCVLMSSSQLQPAHPHQGFWHFVVKSFTFSVAPTFFIANRAAHPEPSYVKMSNSSRCNSAVHADVRRAVRENPPAAARPVAYSSASPLERAMTCCVEQLKSMVWESSCPKIPDVLGLDSEPLQPESPPRTCRARLGPARPAVPAHLLRRPVQRFRHSN